MAKVSYAQKNRGEKALLHSLFADEQDEKRGGYYGVEFGRRRMKDDGAGRDRGAIRPDHAVARQYGTGRALGSRTGDRDFGVPDRAFGYAHVDGRLTNRPYASEQRYHAASAGAGLSGGRPVWASTSRVRANAGDEYAWDAKGGFNYGYPNRRGPF